MLKSITVPDMGNVAEVDVIEVLIKPGDMVDIEKPLLVLESDKATMEVPSSTAGIVREVLVAVGDKVSAGHIVVTIEMDVVAETTALLSAEVEESLDANQAITASVSVLPSMMPSITSIPSADHALQLPTSPLVVHAGPAVRRLARELGIELSQVEASGPKQRITQEDLYRHVKREISRSPSAGGLSFDLPQVASVDFSAFGPITSQPLSRINQLSGKFLHRNWLQVPHVTQFIDADITELEAFRQSQKTALEKQQVRLTPLVFIMKAVVATLKVFPKFNASLNPDGKSLTLKHYYHIGVAVDTPDGLVVPVIRDVDQKGLVTLAKELADVSEKARQKQLTPQDMQGGCFSISSLGGIGGTAFTPIVNVPEVAILGVSQSEMKPIWQNLQWEPRLMLPLSLSYDHRVIDGAEGARFAVTLAKMLTDIRTLLL
jgi:pyruvate dehydrogenase E2 component (dihydrolipoamide acetyltransferase)